MKFTVTVKTASGTETHKGVANVDALIARACLQYGPCAFSVRPE